MLTAPWDNQKSGSVVDKVDKVLKELNKPAINNSKIISRHISYKGLHLSQHGILEWL